MYSYSKKNNFLVLTRLMVCCYEFNQLKSCLNLYENEKLFNWCRKEIEVLLRKKEKISLHRLVLD